MKNPSPEQVQIINSVCNGNSVIVDSVAGSGKTTTNLWISKALPEKKILLLTYNRRLRLETKTKLINEGIYNIEVHTYHSFCVNYFCRECFTDEGIEKFFKNNNQFVSLSKLSYDIIVIDEAQDMTQLYFKIVIHIIRLSQLKPSQLCIFGDVRQSIYEFKRADPRFLSRADKIFTNFKQWEKHTLHQSFRLNSNMTNFLNAVIFKDNLIQSDKISNIKPKYLVCDVFASGKKSIILREIIYLLEIYEPEDFFIISPSVKNPKCPLRKVANELVNHGVNIFVPVSDDEKLDDDLVKGKMVFSTFHQTKGLERKVVIVFTFDISYFKLFEKSKCPLSCPNVVYVALTRATDKLYMIHHYENDYLPFVSRLHLSEHADIIRDKSIKIKRDFNNKIPKTAVTDLIRHVSPHDLCNALSFLEISKVREIEYKIDVPTKIKQKTTVENVSDITGVAIPSYYEYTQKGTMTILEVLKEKNFMPESTLSNSQCCIVDSDDDDEDESAEFEENFEKIDNLLKLSNQWNAYVSGYNHKLSQIKTYDWVSKPALSKCLNRFESLNLSKYAQYEVEYEVEGYSELCFRKLVGFIDCIDNDNVYEFKCVSKLETEHIIQTALYMYIHHREKLLSKKYNYFLYNILTGEMLRIDASMNNLKEMVAYLFKIKYQNKENYTSDEQFDKEMVSLFDKITFQNI